MNEKKKVTQASMRLKFPLYGNLKAQAVQIKKILRTLRRAGVIPK